MFYPDFHGCLECFTSEFERVRPGFFRKQSLRPDENNEVILRIMDDMPVTLSKIRLDGSATGFNVFVPIRAMKLRRETGQNRLVLLYDMDRNILEEDPDETSVYLNAEKDKVSVAVEVRDTPQSCNISIYLIHATRAGINCYEQHIQALANSFAHIKYIPRGKRVRFSTLGQ